MRASSSPAFILPILIVFSIVLMSSGLVALQYISSSTGSVQTQYYNAVAKEAADAGASQALSCIRNNAMMWSDTNPLQVNTDCNGTVNSIQNDYLSRGNGGTWKSNFRVSNPNQQSLSTDFTSTGTVSFYYAGSSTPTNTYTQTTKVNIPTKGMNEVHPVAQGTAITELKAGGEYTCSIANMSTYCWGLQSIGQTGRGNVASSQLTALPMDNGSITGKRTYGLDTGAYNGCVIADGYGSCWGTNHQNQLGANIPTDYNVGYPPTAVGGALSTRYVQKIAQGTSSDQLARASQFGCAISGVKVYCWGGNGYAATGQVRYDNCWGFCPVYVYGKESDGTSQYPLAVFGYENPERIGESQSQVYKKPPTDLDTGAYNACVTSNGTVYCWGDRMTVFNGGGSPTSGDSSRKGSLTGKVAYSVTHGESTGCAIANSQAHCWGAMPGNGTEGEYFYSSSVPPTLVPNGSGSPINGKSIEKVSMADNQGPTCLISDGKAYCWGAYNTTKSRLAPALYDMGTETIQDVAAGKTHGCLLANASSYCFGANTSGQHGTNDYVEHATPTKTQGIGLTSGEAATNISAGNQHSCAVVNGYIYCWGKNDKGQLGTGDTMTRLSPYGLTSVTDTQGATMVSAGTSHSCGIINGSAYCWGDDSSGQLGDGGAYTNKFEPVQVGGALANKGVTDIDTGKSGTCAVADSQAYCWGDNSSAQLGNGSTGGNSTTPVAVQGLNGLAVTKVTVGDKFACAIANTQLYCWGDNQFGALGIGSNGATKYSSAQKVNGFDNSSWTDVEAGSTFACGIADSIAKCWGDNTNGQIGQNASGGIYNTPVSVMSNIAANSLANKSTREISVGASHACSISNGLAYCWGDNSNGKLGNGSVVQQNVSTPVVAAASSLGTNYPYKISSGGTSSCAIANGKITCWGAGDQGQLGVTGSTASQSSPNTWVSDYIREQRTLDLTNIIMF